MQLDTNPCMPVYNNLIMNPSFQMPPGFGFGPPNFQMSFYPHIPNFQPHPMQEKPSNAKRKTTQMRKNSL